MINAIVIESMCSNRRNSRLYLRLMTEKWNVLHGGIARTRSEASFHFLFKTLISSKAIRECILGEYHPGMALCLRQRDHATRESFTSGRLEWYFRDKFHTHDIVCSEAILYVVIEEEQSPSVF